MCFTFSYEVCQIFDYSELRKKFYSWYIYFHENKTGRVVRSYAACKAEFFENVGQCLNAEHGKIAKLINAKNSEQY